MDAKLLKEHRVFWVLGGRLRPVKHPSIPDEAALVGFRRQRRLLTQNTLALLEGKPFNDALLWGKKGTGKSTLVRAQLRLSDRLRLVQLDLSGVEFLVEFLDFLHEVPQLKFILLLEDLSFESGSLGEVKLLKTLLDGSVIERPPNAVFYATSNRRFLTGPPSSDGPHRREEEEDLYSLADRFGLKLGFTDFTKEEYLEAVKLHASRFGLKFDETLKRKALEFAAERGYSGRSALQFVKLFASTL
ncbi:MAG: DUF815 domain-containing protein [Aquificae bacterium]|nr:DUF815 domain-containing protein [Aquificota bacterium]